MVIDKVNKNTNKDQINFFKIYISFFSFTPSKNYVPHFLESPPNKSLFLQKDEWRTDSIIAPIS